MPKLDKSAYKSGMLMVGGDFPGYLAEPGPTVTYGQPLKQRPVPSTDLAEIGKRLDAAKKKLDEIAAFVSAEKRR